MLGSLDQTMTTNHKCNLFHNGHGQALIKQAEQLGLITRRKAMPEGKGNHLMVNALTAKGKKIAVLAKQVYTWH